MSEAKKNKVEKICLNDAIFDMGTEISFEYIMSLKGRKIKDVRITGLRMICEDDQSYTPVIEFELILEPEEIKEAKAVE
jgi:plasmid replication initiation protein